jgi:hypothetical protein
MPATLMVNAVDLLRVALTRGGKLAFRRGFRLQFPDLFTTNKIQSKLTELSRRSHKKEMRPIVTLLELCEAYAQWTWICVCARTLAQRGTAVKKVAAGN